jgi:hypothetical protein
MHAFLLFSVLCAAAAAHSLRGKDMFEIKVDIGQNIFETAKKSGAPKYSTKNIAGVVIYEQKSKPFDVPVRYHRQGYDITALPLFALTLYADEANANGLAVERITLQFSKDAAVSHTSAQEFVRDLISQFQNGKWKRYIGEFCPAVTGRSAFLNEAGEPGQIGSCPLDPAYRLSADDWIGMTSMTLNYKWIGDEVLATLTVRHADDTRGITYSIDLEFDDLTLKRRREQTNLARKLAEGDAQGRNSTVKDKEAKLARKSRIKLLEENAQRRGDAIVPR